jgi:type VI secretion system protein ImpI
MSDRPLLVHVDDPERRVSTRSAFIKSPVRVGRGELNDLVVEASFVSTWHGLVQFDADGIRFVDLGSTNGTFLDGVKLERNVPAPIAPGSDLRIGPIRITLSWGAPEQRPEPVRPKTQFAMRAIAPPAADFRPAPAPIAPAVADARPAPAPAPPPAAPVAPAAAPVAVPREVEEAAQRAVEDASWQLGILHDAYRQARENLEAAASQAVLALPEAARRRARAVMAERFPMAGGEPVAAAPAAEVPARPAPAGDPALPILRAFAQTYVAGGVPLEGREEIEAFLGTLAEVLEAAVKSYLELRRGYDEFGKEMGVRVPQGDGAVGRIRDARQLLGYLLQATAGSPRAQELASAFADLMIHQVALLNAVTAGAKDLLQRLSPEAITSALDEGGGRISLGVKPLREGAQWRAFVQAYAALADDDHAFSDALFGKAFARAYGAVAGHRAPPPDGPDDYSTPRPG